ncbi:hypothetical protein [Acetobacterium sp.]|uniref:hypothetical protein n=1 Tax=Acetobacterium sp. TaxID=1872094 RepID=UPI002727F4A1|nr:hypothetical protein [Acetobacterium sp.]MDO9491418.1 hypothetical protein [Acetobacterium sp.]
MAGEIFIAKEATSQDIKTIVDANGNALSSLSTNLAIANANINTVKSDVATVKTDVAKLKQPVGKNYRFFSINFDIAVSSLTQHVSISGGGYLVSAVMFATSTSSPGGRLKVVIDGTTLFDIDCMSGRLTAAGQGVGVVNKSAFINTRPFGIPISDVNGTSVNNASGLSLPLSATQPTYGCLFLLPEHIRFNSSLVVYGQKNTQTSENVEYILD